MVTEYTYNDLSFTLSNLKVVSTENGNRCLMDKAYTYDGLYRLQTANGFYLGNASKIAAYNLVMAYDNLHNITGKKLDIGQLHRYSYDASGERTVKLTGDGGPLLRAMRAYYGLIQTRNGFQRFSAMFKKGSSLPAFVLKNIIRSVLFCKQSDFFFSISPHIPTFDSENPANVADGLLSRDYVSVL